jgi:hypothetical protein
METMQGLADMLGISVVEALLGRRSRNQPMPLSELTFRAKDPLQLGARQLPCAR